VNQLFNEVKRLRPKVQRLQEEQQPLRQGLQAAPEPQPQAAKETSLPVILVFRDGHQMEVQGLDRSEVRAGSAKARCWPAIAIADQQRPDAGLQSQLLISKSQMLACNRDC